MPGLLLLGGQSNVSCLSSCSSGHYVPQPVLSFEGLGGPPVHERRFACRSLTRPSPLSFPRKWESSAVGSPHPIVLSVPSGRRVRGPDGTGISPFAEIPTASCGTPGRTASIILRMPSGSALYLLGAPDEVNCVAEICDRGSAKSRIVSQVGQNSFEF